MVATHGPIKTFGLAGVCDTLLVGNTAVVDAFDEISSRFHLTRNNVFGLAAFETAYRDGSSWLDELLASVARNIASLERRLPEQIGLVATEGTIWRGSTSAGSASTSPRSPGGSHLLPDSR